MFSTAEVRWFYQGGIPGDVQSWFDHVAEEPILQPARLDTYLEQPNNSGLGIKLRQGRIEIKQRVREFGKVDFEHKVSGVVESWRKWSFLIAQEQMGHLPPAILGDSWMQIRKERSLFSFEIIDREVKPTSLPDYSSGGCNVELTLINVERETWWSLGLEAFGDEKTNYNRLEIAAHHVFSKSPRPGLAAQSSFGYPQWLENVRKNARNRPPS